jgi:uracil-DNA glycosylase
MHLHRSTSIHSFVRSLVNSQPPAAFRNPYRAQAAASNLMIFLTKRDHRLQTLLLVGEAPGYRGAAVSGVALTSTAILVEPWQNPWNAFGPKSGYVAHTGAGTREATATMVWSGLASIFGDAPLPLTWNAVPFHPSRPDGTNAPLPRKSVDLGKEWLERLLALFPESVPVALGERAHEALSSIGMEHAKVRHPSRGGKQMFLAGLEDVRMKLSDERPSSPISPKASKAGLELPSERLLAALRPLS